MNTIMTNGIYSVLEENMKFSHMEMIYLQSFAIEAGI